MKLYELALIFPASFDVFFVTSLFVVFSFSLFLFVNSYLKLDGETDLPVPEVFDIFWQILDSSFPFTVFLH